MITNKTELTANKSEQTANKSELPANRTGVAANRNRTGVAANRTGVAANRTGVAANRTGVAGSTWQIFERSVHARKQIMLMGRGRTASQINATWFSQVRRSAKHERKLWKVEFCMVMFCAWSRC